MAEISNKLPPGWDSKYDPRTQRFYFINHYTKQTTWDDPRLKYRQIHGTPTHVQSHPVEHIPLQHGSPEFRRNYVYPSQTCPQPAFQMPKSVQIQDLSNLRMSPAPTSRTSVSNSMNSNNRSITAHSNGTQHSTIISHAISRMQETNLTQVPTDTEQSVSKISTMFPTVSETHIRLLMKKYYNREAVVISALQVEKYPITTPGPFTTPPPSRNFTTSATTASHVPLHMTPPPGVRNATGSRTGSPGPVGRQSSAVGSPLIGDYRNSPKPHSSPKMKLRYMKSIFPQAEETVLLEVLEKNDNNVQKASEALKKMGFEKREIKVNKSKKEQKTTPAKTVAPPKIFTAEEKVAIKTSLQEKYKDIPERVLIMALESVDYNKSRAVQILDIMVQEEASPKGSSDSTPKKEDNKIGEASTSTVLKKSKSSLITPSPSIHTLQCDKLDGKSRRTKEKNNSISKIEESSTSTIFKKSKSSLITPSPSIHILQCDKLDGKSRRTKEKKNSIREPLQENNAPAANNYRSTYLIQTTGPNSNLVKGSDNGMLLEDYVSWDGPDPNLREGNRGSLAKGPNKSLLMQRSYQPCGPNTEMRKGPALGLAKGSIYSQMKNLVVGESRGK